MKFEIIATPRFRKDLKRLAKKYPSMKSDFAVFIDSMEKDPQQGTPLGQNCYKIRLSIESKSRGKSSGARIITCCRVVKQVVFLLTIYDKSEKNDLSDQELKELISSIL